MTIADTISQAKSAFCRHFEADPVYGAAAPGRVNLIGGHVDYNDGLVLPLAINRYTVILGTTNDTLKGRIFSSHCNEMFELDLNGPVREATSSWKNYVSGVVFGFVERGIDLAGFDAVIHSAVPVGGGLSSSAALEVALATFLESTSGNQIDKVEKALLCRRAENEFAGVPCGIMDQFASVFGEVDCLVKLDCQSQHVELIEWPGDDVTVLVVDCRSPHQLVDGAYAERRTQAAKALEKLGEQSYRDVTLKQLESKQSVLSPVEFRRARHIVTEIDRAGRCAASIRDADWKTAGRLLGESHDSLRNDYQVSCTELDLLVEIAQEIGVEGGVFGARMTGGGFGGCVILLVSAEKSASISKSVLAQYFTGTGINASTFTTRPARGAFNFLVDDAST